VGVPTSRGWPGARLKHSKHLAILANELFMRPSVEKKSVAVWQKPTAESLSLLNNFLGHHQFNAAGSAVGGKIPK